MVRDVGVRVGGGVMVDVIVTPDDHVRLELHDSDAERPCVMEVLGDCEADGAALLERVTTTVVVKVTVAVDFWRKVCVGCAVRVFRSVMVRVCGGVGVIVKSRVVVVVGVGVRRNVVVEE